VVVGSTDDKERAVEISTRALHQSVVGQLLGDQLWIGLDVQFEIVS
jgi:hypothetical protein